MNIIKKLKCWLIHLLGGYTEEEYDYVIGKWEKTLELNDKLYEIEENRLRIAENATKYWCGKYTSLEKTLRTVESYITIDSALGYTEGNVIAESKQQTYYQLGKAVYPYAKHFITSDGKYIATVNVQEVDE